VQLILARGEEDMFFSGNRRREEREALSSLQGTLSDLRAALQARDEEIRTLRDAAKEREAELADRLREDYGIELEIGRAHV